MDEDDPFAPASKRPLGLQAQLDLASVEELEARIQALRHEIAACEAAISGKKAQRAAADSVFGKKTQ